MTSWVVVDIFWHWKGTGVIEGWAATRNGLMVGGLLVVAYFVCVRIFVGIWAVVGVFLIGGFDEVRGVGGEDWVSVSGAEAA